MYVLKLYILAKALSIYKILSKCSNLIGKPNRVSKAETNPAVSRANLTQVVNFTDNTFQSNFAVP